MSGLAIAGEIAAVTYCAAVLLFVAYLLFIAAVAKLDEIQARRHARRRQRQYDAKFFTLIKEMQNDFVG